MQNLTPSDVLSAIMVRVPSELEDPLELKYDGELLELSLLSAPFHLSNVSKLIQCSSLD